MVQHVLTQQITVDEERSDSIAEPMTVAADQAMQEIARVRRIVDIIHAHSLKRWTEGSSFSPGLIAANANG